MRIFTMNMIGGTAGASDYDISLEHNAVLNDFIDIEITAAFNCQGTAGTAGTFGTGTGCLGTAGTAGCFGCGGGSRYHMLQI